MNDTMNDTIRALDFVRGDKRFFLGGSRRMQEFGANIALTQETDYDFYATYDAVLLCELHKLGFTRTGSDHEYYDDEAIEIIELGKVQIVLRKDAQIYKECFESIHPEFYAAYLWKQNPNCDRSLIQPFFNQLFKLRRM